MSNTNSNDIPRTLAHKTHKNPYFYWVDGKVFSNNNHPKPYAFIRFGNEIICAKQSLESILKFTDRGILCYHELLPGVESDGTLEIVEQFVQQNPGFKLVKYPIPIIPHNCDFVKDNLYKLYRYWLLDCFYNYAFLHLKELVIKNGDQDQAVFFKVDLDHIYDYDSLYESYLHLLVNWTEIDIVYWTKANVFFDPRGLAKEYDFENPANNPAIEKSIKQRSNGAIDKELDNNNHSIGLQKVFELGDHFIAKVGAITQFVACYREESPETNEKYCYWELMLLHKNVYWHNYSFYNTSLHFFFEKFVFYKDYCERVNEVINSSESIYEGLNKTHLKKYPIQQTLVNDFWSYENCKQLLKNLNWSQAQEFIDGSKKDLNIVNSFADFESLINTVSTISMIMFINLTKSLIMHMTITFLEKN